MNDAVRVSTDGLLTTAQMAARSDFTLGLAVVCPSTRSIAGPGGTADVEPRVMQVLVVLADAAGQVVTRDTLFNRCWGGVYVGDDSLNRAIAAVRRLSTEIAGGSFEIETIPRTGYRLVGATPAAIGAGSASQAAARGLTRRQVGAAALGVTAFGGLGFWATTRTASDRRFNHLVEQSATALREGTADEGTARLLQEAVSIRPDSAKAWGMLALLRSSAVFGAPPEQAPSVVEVAQNAAQRALALDAAEPNAQLAMLALQGSTLDWISRDRKLRQIIAADPTHVLAIGELVLLLQATGMSRESWNWNERALQLQPLSRDFLCKRAMKLWIAGHTSAADKVIDQIRALYPKDPWPWFIRVMILAMTGRSRAAAAMLDSQPELMGSSADVAIWRAGIAALASRSPSDIAKARETSIHAADAGPWLAGQSVMILSALGVVDSAFDIAEGFLLSRGPVAAAKSRVEDLASDAVARINTQWLFTPPCAAMRADARFLPLCEGMGLADYWAARGVRPDYQLKR